MNEDYKLLSSLGTRRTPREAGGPNILETATSSTLARIPMSLPAQACPLLPRPGSPA
jgi:hypothetical protein